MTYMLGASLANYQDVNSIYIDLSKAITVQCMHNGNRYTNGWERYDRSVKRSVDYGVRS